MSASAVLAAHQATEAAAALLLHATELSGFGEVDVVAHLAEALARSIGLHVEINVESCDLGYRQDLGELQVACRQYLERYSG